MLDKTGFDRWSGDYEKSVSRSESEGRYPFAGYGRVLDFIYDRVAPAEGKRVLDIGFGTGTLTVRFHEAGCAVTGIDFSREMIKAAGEKMPGARLIEWDFTGGIPPELSGEAFDFIVSTYAIHHLTDEAKAAFISELRAHLAPGGEILIGDVAFETRETLEACRAASGDAWDGDEIYIAAEELSGAIPGLEFLKLSPCAGVCVIK